MHSPVAMSNILAMAIRIFCHPVREAGTDI
jgi:hypothetical protein